MPLRSRLAVLLTGLAVQPLVRATSLIQRRTLALVAVELDESLRHGIQAFVSDDGDESEEPLDRNSGRVEAARASGSGGPGSTARRRRRSVPQSGLPSLDARASKELALAQQNATQRIATSGAENQSSAGLSPSSLLASGTDSHRSNESAAVNSSDGAHAGAPFDYMSGGFFGPHLDTLTDAVRERPFSTTGLLSKRASAAYLPGATSGLYAEPSVVVELHLRNVSMQQLKTSTHGSVVGLLLGLNEELSKAEELEHFHLKVLSITGRYLVKEGASSGAPRPHAEEEVLVKLSVAPVDAKAGGQAWIVDAMNARLRAPDNALLRSPFAFALKNASVVESPAGAQGHLSSRPFDRNQVTQVGALLLPIAVSAVFTAMLVWLAAI